MSEKSLQKESADHGGSEEWWHEMLQMRFMNLLFYSKQSFLPLPLVQASILFHDAWGSIYQTNR